VRKAIIVPARIHGALKNPARILTAGLHKREAASSMGAASRFE
jgi:hypothetical protein